MSANPLESAAAKSRVYAKLEQAEALADLMCGEGFSNNELTTIQQDSLHFLLGDLIRAAQSDFEQCFTSLSTATPEQNAWRRDPGAILASYRQTVDAAANVLATLKCAGLKRVSAADQEAIQSALANMEGHVCAAREDFLMEVDHA